MPIRGENIGTAYVRIVGDGSGLSDDIKDAFDDAEPGVREGGRNHGKVYSKGYRDAFGKTQKEILDELNKGLNRSLARQELADNFFKSRGWQRLRKRFEREGGAAGSLYGRELERHFRDSGALDRIGDQMERWGPEMRRAQKAILDEIHGEALEMNEQYNQAVMKQRQDLDKDFEMRHKAALKIEQETLEEAYWLNRDYDLKRQHMLNEAYQQNRDYNLRLQRLVRDTQQEIALINREMAQLLAGDDRAMSKSKLTQLLRDRTAAIEKNKDALRLAGYHTKNWTETLDDNDRALLRVNPRLRRWISTTDRVADVSGRAFGRGARNDFINFIGATVRGMTRLVTLPLRVADSIQTFANKFAAAGSAGARFGLIAGGIAKFAGVAGAAMAGLILIVGPLASALSLAAGAVLALASSLTGALSAGLFAVAGAFAPLALGIGAAVMGFANLEGEAKRAAKGIGEAFKELGKAAAEGLTFDRTPFSDAHNHRVRTFTQQMGALKGMVSGMDRLFTNLGRAVGDVIDIFLDVVKASGRWESFIDKIDGSAENVGWMAARFRELGRGFANFFAGGLGFFEAMMPLIKRFTGWIRDLGVRFNEWANSVSGQRSIREFFERGVESAKSFGSFLSGVWDMLSAIIRLGSGEGDSMFRSLGDSARRLAAYLNTPQGAAAFKQWMADAREFAEALGRLVIGVGKLIAALDNDLTRAMATGAIDAMTAAFETLAWPIQQVVDLFNQIKGAGDSMSGSLQLGSRWASAMGGALRGFATGGIVGSIVGIGKGFVGLGNDAASAGGNVLGLGAAFDEAMGGVADAANGAANAYSDAMQKIQRESIAAELSQEGLIRAGNKLGLTTRDMIDASLGNAAAIDRVRKALKGGGSEAIMFGHALLGVRGDVKDAQMTIKDYEHNIQDLKTALAGVPKKFHTEIAALGFKPAMREVADFQRQAKLTPKQLRIALEATGLNPTRQQIRLLTRDVKGIPERIETRMEIEGVPKSMKELQRLLKQQNATPKEISTVVKALGVEKAWKDFKKTQDEADETDKKRPTPKVGLDDRDFQRNLRGVNTDLDRVGRERKTPRIDVNSNAGAVAAAARAAIASVQSKTVTITTQYRSVGRQGGGGSGRYISTGNATAIGGIFRMPSNRLIGEAGPEAVVPLSRPLGQVDPAVRWLSAIAQGKAIPMASGGVVGAGKTVNVEQTIITPASDPRAVAAEVVNHLVGVGY